MHVFCIRIHKRILEMAISPHPLSQLRLFSANSRSLLPLPYSWKVCFHNGWMKNPSTSPDVMTTLCRFPSYPNGINCFDSLKTLSWYSPSRNDCFAPSSFPCSGAPVLKWSWGLRYGSIIVQFCFFFSLLISGDIRMCGLLSKIRNDPLVAASYQLFFLRCHQPFLDLEWSKFPFHLGEIRGISRKTVEIVLILSLSMCCVNLNCYPWF